MSVSDMQDTAQAKGRPAANGLGEAAANEAKAGGQAAAKAKQVLQDATRRGAEAARAQAAMAGRKLTQAAQERPMESLSTTLAVGLLAGFLIGFFVARAAD
jgi:ElaB/YqjD/DUF883 family membrane-anchored ribosome-binding protein